MPYIPSPYDPNQISPQGGYAPPPVPGNAGRDADHPADFPGWNPFNSRSAFDQPQMIGQQAYQQGQNWQNQFSDRAGYDQNLEAGYGATANELYSPIWNGGGGYTPEMQQNVLQSQGLQDVADQLPGNQLTPQEQFNIQGDPNSAYNSFQSQAPTLTDWSLQAGKQLGQQVNSAENKGVGILQYGQNAVDKAAGDPGLNVSDQYLQQAGMSDQQVRDIAESAARGVGAQFGATKDEIRQRAAASGNASPMAIGSAMGALDRSSAAGQADAQTAARLDALAQQRAAATGIQNTQLQAGQYRAGLGTQAGLGLTNTAMQNNQYLTGAGIGATEYGANLATDAQKYNMTTGAQLQQQAEQNASTRAAQIAGNRQSTNQNNQQTELGINNAQSGRYQQAYAPWLAAQQEGRQAATGQQQYYGGQANQANQFRLQGQQLQNQTELGAAGQYANWGAGGGQGFGDVLKKSAANALGQWAGPSGATAGKNVYDSFRRGGLLDRHQLVEVGEGNRPEVILPLDPSTRPIDRNVFEHLGASLGAAMGVKRRIHSFGHHNQHAAA